MKYKLDFYSSHHQFYISDKNCNDSVSADFWTEEAVEQRMAVGYCGIAAGTQSYGYVRGELEIFSTKPPVDSLEKYDHVVEAGITVISGELEVFGCLNFEDKISIDLKPGTYRVRVYGKNFESVSEPDLDHDTDDDFYRVEIWTDTDLERRVLKQYREY